MKKCLFVPVLAAAILGLGGSSLCAAEPAEDFTYEDLRNYEFTFASGAGGWSTSLFINSDGTFFGNYHDSEMGSTGEDYPDGSMYYCEFTGKFKKPKKIDDYTYLTVMDEIQYEREPGEEEIIDGIRYIYSDAYGLNDSEYFYIYLPGSELSTLPEGFMDWMHYIDGDGTTLPFYGLYNEEPMEGFTSYKHEGGIWEDGRGEDEIESEYDDADWDAYDWSQLDGEDDWNWEDDDDPLA